MSEKEDISVVSKYIGEFKVSCGKILITDPCYKKQGTFGTKIVDNVKNGKWAACHEVEHFSYDEETHDMVAMVEKMYREKADKCELIMKKVRVTSKNPINLTIFHGGYNFYDINRWLKEKKEKIEGSIGVDSGKVGFFDYHFYPEDPGTYKDKNSFYRQLCNACSYPETFGDAIRFNNRRGAVVNIGAISPTYNGDGSYTCYGIRNEQEEFIAFTIDFMD